MLYRTRLKMLLAGTMISTLALSPAALAQSADEADQQTITVTAGSEDAGDKHRQAADRAPSIYIAIEEIQRTDPQTLRDLFRGEASVSVGGGIPMAQKVYVNGIDENNLAVTVDGVQQGNRIFHHTSTNAIDPALLKAVRVDAGVAPADAGFGALGGAIVYETVDVPDLLINDRNFGAFGQFSYDSNGRTFTETAAAYGRHSGFELLGYGKLAKGDDYTAGNGWKVPGTGADMQSLLLKAAYESAGGYRFEVTGQQLVDDAMRPYRSNIGGFRGESAVRIYDTQRRNFSFNFNREVQEGLWNPEVVIGYSENHFKVPSPYGSDSKVGSFTAKAENVFDFGERTTLTTGVDFLHQDADYYDPGETFNEKVANAGFYAQARVTPMDWLALSFGGRADSNHFEGKDGSKIDSAGFSGNASAKASLSEHFSVNAGYSNVFGGIDLEETFEFWRPWDYSQLKAVRSENLTAGAEVNFEGWFARANVFNTRFSNYRDGDTGRDVTSYGFNLTGGYDWGDGFAKVTFSDTHVSAKGFSLESYYLLNIGAPIGQTIAGEIAHTFRPWDLTVGATLDAALEYDDGAAAGYAPLDAFAVVNAYAEYKPKDFDYLTVRFEANNLFDENYADRATYGQEYGVITPLYEPGRSFRLSARLRY